MLGQSEIESYHRDGFVIPSRFRLGELECASLRSALDQMIADNPGIPTDRLINAHLNGAPPYGLTGSAEFGKLARDSRILDLVEQVLGPDLILWLTHVFCKAAGSGREVPWHQDGQYWPIRPHATCTVWVALDKVDRTNGAMRVIPGSHNTGQIDHRGDDSPDLTLNLVAVPEQFDERKAHYLELEPGQVSMHHIDIVHGSAPNTSSRRRAGLALRYMPATACFRRDIAIPNTRLDWAVLPLELVRGENRQHSNDLSAGHGHFDMSSTSARL